MGYSIHSVPCLVCKLGEGWPGAAIITEKNLEKTHKNGKPPRPQKKPPQNKLL